MSATTVEETGLEGLDELVQAICDEHHDVETQAAEVHRALMRRTKGNPAHPWLRKAIADGVGEWVYRRRAALTKLVKRHTINRCTRGIDVMQEVSDAMARTWLEHVFFADGRAFGDVLGGELPDFAEQYDAVGDGFKADARFFRLVAARVPARGKVRNYLSAGDVDQLWQEARGV